MDNRTTIIIIVLCLIIVLFFVSLSLSAGGGAYYMNKKKKENENKPESNLLYYKPKFNFNNKNYYISIVDSNSNNKYKFLYKTNASSILINANEHKYYLGLENDNLVLLNCVDDFVPNANIKTEEVTTPPSKPYIALGYIVNDKREQITINNINNNSNFQIKEGNNKDANKDDKFVITDLLKKI